MTNNCPHDIGCIQYASSVLGSKWTGQIIRELTTGPKRFCQFERALPTLNPRTLSRRLDDLESHDIIAKIDDNTGYRLTTKGTDLLPILQAMATWGAKYPTPDPAVATLP